MRLFGPIDKIQIRNVLCPCAIELKRGSIKASNLLRAAGIVWLARTDQASVEWCQKFLIVL